MQRIEIKLTDKHTREYKYFLGERYGKNKKIETLLRIAIMEVVAMQARKEADAIQKHL